ncbi:MAG: SRPBCC family protein [Moheibacter sp.]
MEKQIITIQADVHAPIKQVWENYTTAKHITKWNFATEDWQCPHAEVNLIIGGKYLTRMEAKDGSFGFDFEAIFKEIVPNSKIIYQIADGRKVKIIFEEKNNTTQVIINFEAENQNPIEMQRDGWQAILNNFKNYTEKINPK